MKYMTAGELRGASLVAIVDDVPAGLRLQAASIQADLDRWSHGCSCGERREVDCAAILSGVSADGRTTGSPLSLVVDNAAYRASLEDEAPGQAAVPRPGSADLAGLLATDANDCRSIVEGSSARSQAALIAASAVAREFLAEFGVEIQSYVTRIGAAAMREQPIDFETLRYTPLEIESSPVRRPSAQASRAMEEEIAAARVAGDTLGGEVAVAMHGVAPALGSYRGGGMMARLSKAAFSVNDVVSVSFGSARDMMRRRGSAVYDSAVLGAHGFAHTTNMLGGIEGGLTTGASVVMRVGVAPSASLRAPQKSIDLETLSDAESSSAAYSPCLVGGVAVAIEAEIAFALASAYQERFGGVAMSDIHSSYDAYMRRLRLAAR